MTATAPFRPEHFARVDETGDHLFYAEPRLVHHIDEPGVEALAALHGALLPAGGRILDLMSSWVSHLPSDVAYERVDGLGMNAAELSANPRLTGRHVQSLNDDPVLAFPDAAYDACIIALSVQYLTDPVTVFREVARVLKPQAPLVVSFSNRCFPTKAIDLWQSLDDAGHAQLVALYMESAGGFGAARVLDASPEPGRSDPLFAVVAERATR